MEIQNKPLQKQWLDLLTNPHTLGDLARLLGTSEYLWEDFIRLQYETILPMLHPSEERSPFSLSSETIGKRLDEALAGAQSLKEKKSRLNQFKDQEIFLIDLDHILNAEVGFRSLSEKLTILAEEVIHRATRIVYDFLVNQFGRPRTVAGLNARYAILGLGKLGGAALGYASDLEVLFVYSDNGQTDGTRSIQNSEFFDRLVKELNRFISAKREGIFHLDLRLRPYGQAAPLASSLEGFCRYYGRGGKAHAYERLALVRMRAIGGDHELGSQLERLRDEMVYASDLINIDDLQELRLRQFHEKAKGDRPNAKFSPGALVDLEYGVQILQVIHGRKAESLRSPRIHTALNALTDAGVLDPSECAHLTDAYDFLRNLINGMRMLRGHAKDLFLPNADSKEYNHLARRMGYSGRSPLAPGIQLHIDFERHTAAVRLFMERYFGRESIPGHGVGTVADLVLSDQVPEELRVRILSEARFKDPGRAYVNLKALAGSGSQKVTFVRLALLASDVLGRTPDPDMALNNWERFIGRRVSPEFHYQTLLSQPMRLEILLGLFSGSQFLADTLIRNPGFLDWVMIPELLHHLRKREDIEEELRRAAEGHGSLKAWRNDLRRLRRREVLRIGTRDLCLRVPTRDVMHELSVLAEAFTQVAFERALRTLEGEEATRAGNLVDDKRFCVMALGKLGGKELNYSSDIDLLALWDDRSPSAKGDGILREKMKGFYARLMERIRSDLSQHTEEGYAFRVDLRLRPFGRAGELVPSLSSIVEYYRRDASLWEIQATLKMRPIAGNLQTGFALLDRLRPELLKKRDRSTIVEAIDRMRNGAIKTYSGTGRPLLDIKSGLGGLRDVEFLVQGLQLIHSHEAPHLLESNTLLSLGALSEGGILPVRVAEALVEDYLFLRKVEHYLQILEDQQIHALPKGKAAITALAKRIHGTEGKGSLFMDEVRQCLGRIREHYTTYLLHGTQDG
jgi:glutamate-ammonia-ligase adenylyltransferase